MKGNAKVIAVLNEALQEELLAINQYFLHSEMCENWKYEALAKFIKKQSIDEMKHAEKLIERILFLDATPTLTGPTQLKIGKNVKEQLASDLELELNAVKMYNNSIKVAREEGDNASAELFAGASGGRRRACGLAGSATAPDRRDRVRAVSVAAAQEGRVEDC